MSDTLGNSDLTNETNELQPRSLVIGFGNPLRSDDGIGWRIARELRSRLDASKTEVIECHQLAPDLADTIHAAALIIFVDAAMDGVPGEVRHRRIVALPAEDSSTAFSHGLTPDALLSLAANLYAKVPEAHLFTVSGRTFGYGESFSPEVTLAMPVVMAKVEDLLNT